MLYLYIAGAIVANLCIASYIGSMRWLKIKYLQYYTNKDVSLKILHISDFHSNSLKRTNERMWEKIHALDFDLVAITGDLLQSRLGEIEPIKPHLQRLALRAPVFFVDGNHEEFIYTEVYRELEKLGVKGLNNRCVRLCINGGQIDGRRVMGRKTIEKMTTVHSQLPCYCWGMPGVPRPYGLGPDMHLGDMFLATPGTYYHEGWGWCRLSMDPAEKFVMAYFTPFVKPDQWEPNPVYNPEAIMCSGLI